MSARPRTRAAIDRGRYAVKALLSLAVTLVLLAPAAAATAETGEETPLRTELLSARTVFVKQTLIDPRIVSRFRSELGKLERFDVVATEQEADLVATLSANVDYTYSAEDSGVPDADLPTDLRRGAEPGLRPMGTMRVLEDLHLKMFTPQGDEVWVDSVPLGSLTGNASKKLVKRLARRLDEEN